MALDSDPGVGIGTPVAPGVAGALSPHPTLSNIVTAVGELECNDLAVPLPLYAKVIGYSECAFWGVSMQNPPAVHANKPLWIKSERDMVVHYLSEAQAEIEQIVEYPLKARWIASEKHDFQDPLRSEWVKVIEAGVEANEFISDGEAVDHSADPATVGPIATTVTDPEEVYVYHPDTCARIYPSNIDITGGNLTIVIPRCRLLTEEGESVTGGVDYSDTGPAAGLFEQTVDVVRVYNDPSTQGVLVWSKGSGSCPKCASSTDTGCMTILNSEIGEIEVNPATYSNGAWTRSHWGCYCHWPDRVHINYKAGLETLTAQARDAIVRLAHAKMPHDPCNCDPPNYMWQYDREIPRALTRERLNCPFGLQNGAWTAYNFAKSMKVYRASVL